ncbi:MAG: glycoside hydrolase family 3 C-terminal domain-containing protein [Niabella sp.]
MLKKVFFIAGILLSVIVNAQADKSKLRFWDYKLSFEERVNDLVSRLTLEEKVAQMLNHAPAIDRLGIPAYDWWNEVLHGVARTPYHTTVYPQAIAMAATWDTASLYTMARQSALEGRAIHNKAIADGRASERYVGLTYWTPNINIFRDPRWGRGQETYGEDPFLTAMLGKAFVRGLQGEDHKYLLVAACVKHYAVHSGPEYSRHVFDVDPDNYDLWNTYLPAFKELVVNAHVAGVMCAYNAFRTQPCCSSDALMIQILRNQWKFTGYVTSDCGAIDDFFQTHKTHPDARAASVDAVFHGTDVECGNSAYRSLVQAVKDGLIKEAQINTSLKRLFMIRFRLGMFDPASLVKYAQTPASVLESAPHKAQSLKMARQSIVLLKNQNNVLPLSRSIKKIALIGPNAHNHLAVLGNYNGIPSEIVTVLNGIKQKLDNRTEIVYEQGINATSDTMLVTKDIEALYQYDGKPGIRAEYFDNDKLEGRPVLIKTEKEINHQWNEGEAPYPGLRTTHYTARYTTYITSPKTETLSFETQGDDGYRVFINDSIVVDKWGHNNSRPNPFKLPVEKNKTYKIQVDFRQDDWNANIIVKAGYYEKADLTALASRVKDADVIVFAGGISPQLEGEEMPVAIPGFKGGDRTSVMLPAVQTELMRALQKTGKPVIFVMMTGSAIAIPWENEHIPAIINAWYGGQYAGTAIADVLFGDYNPAGRLPVTFYRSDTDLPPYDDYSMNNRTYRYFKGEALYPFGYGLSYTTFKYSNLQVPVAVKNKTAIPVRFTVTNTGKRDGEEVIELYISYQNQHIKLPQKALKGFQRITLKAGETKNIKIDITPDELAVADEKGNRVYPKGKLAISAGGGQPGMNIKATSNTVQKLVSIN